MRQSSSGDSIKIKGLAPTSVHILKRGPDAAWRAIDYIGSASLYAMHARHAMMFFAATQQQAAVVKWTVVGTEHQQRTALTEAKQRTPRVFP